MVKLPTGAILLVFMITLISVAPVHGEGEDAISVTEATGLSMEISPAELAPARVTPQSPFYFLKSLAEKIRWLAAFGPQAKAILAIDLSQTRLAEALEVSGQGNFAMVERLFSEREALLEQAANYAKRIGNDAATQQEVLARVLTEVARGREALATWRGILAGEDPARVENLSAWVETWVGKLEAGLGKEGEGQPGESDDASMPNAVVPEPVPEVTAPEASGSGRVEEATSPPAGGAELSTVPPGPSVWESLREFIFGKDYSLLSPLALPGKK